MRNVFNQARIKLELNATNIGAKKEKTLERKPFNLDKLGDESQEEVVFHSPKAHAQASNMITGSSFQANSINIMSQKAANS